MELVGGALLLVGLFTRSVAFLLSGLMAVAYFYAHAPQGFWPLLNRGELAALYSFVFLYFVFAGPGAWSVDGMFRKQWVAAHEPFGGNHTGEASGGHARKTMP
jgi:putative oxidoreductase